MQKELNERSAERKKEIEEIKKLQNFAYRKKEIAKRNWRKTEKMPKERKKASKQKRKKKVRNCRKKLQKERKNIERKKLQKDRKKAPAG